ncbi:unnamed protein product [Prorocentrum cordatum]|uniref:Ion transport domain-containing protein n=1 Tax=Prorocentrum cordatum TaxID=2364126 RepID=A0ABN9QF84_9DINO|nr:unnamed protein product [Polarella glacialis]
MDGVCAEAARRRAGGAARPTNAKQTGARRKELAAGGRPRKGARRPAGGAGEPTSAVQTAARREEPGDTAEGMGDGADGDDGEDGEEDEEEEESDEEENYVELSSWDKVELEMGWFMYFILMMVTLFSYDMLRDMLEPMPVSDKLTTSFDGQGGSLEVDRGFLYSAFWGTGEAASLVNFITVALSLCNFYSFSVLTEAKMKDEFKHYKFAGIDVDAFDLNRIAELSALPIFTILFLGRLAAVPSHPQWAAYGISGPLRFFFWNGYTLVEAFALANEFVYLRGNMWLEHHDHFNLLWLFFLRVLEMAARNKWAGFVKLTTVVSKKGKLLGVSFVITFVIWTLMSGLYFIANRTNTGESAVWEAARYRDADGELKPFVKFESIPSSMWYVLINRIEHPLADAHVTFFQRFNVCLVCIFAMPIFALPTSVLQAALFPHDGKEELAAESADAPDPQPPRNVCSSYGGISTAILAFGSIFTYFLWTARNTTHSTVFTVPVHVSDSTFATIDGTVAAVFMMEWLWRIFLNGPSYIVSILGVVDLVAWAPGIAHLSLYLDSLQVGPWLCAAIVLRVLKIERYVESFRTMFKIAWESASLLSATLLLSSIMWMVFSTLLYATERDSPDEEMQDTYGSLMRSLWAEIINLHGEWPWADYTARGKGVGCFIALFSIMIFCVPITIFGNGFSRAIMADRTAEDKMFNRDPWQKHCRPEEETQQLIYDLFYEHLHVKPGGTLTLAYRIIRGVLITTTLATTMVTLVMTLKMETMGEWYPTLWRSGFIIDCLAFGLFLCALGCRLVATDMQHAYTFTGICDVISLVALAMTLAPDFRESAFHPTYRRDVGLTGMADDCMVLFRLLCLFSLESYFAALHVLKNVVWLNRKPLIRSGGGLVACWLIHATLLYMFEHNDASAVVEPAEAFENVSSSFAQQNRSLFAAHRGLRQPDDDGADGGDDDDDAELTMADRYASIPRALQYSIVHLFGDFPESDYSLSSKCVHFFGIMVGIAIISSFAGVFIAGFNDYLRDERQEELAELRLRRAIVVMRSTKAIQRRFRASKAIRDEEATQGQMPQPRPRPQASFWKKVALECTFGKLSVLFNCLLCFNLLCTLFSSLPEWNRHGGGRVGSALLWLEMGCTIAFTFECMMHFIATPRFSYWRIIEIICILPGMFEIAYSAQQSLGVQGERNGYLDDVFEALLVVRVVRILNFSVIRREVTMILRTLEEAAPQLLPPNHPGIPGAQRLGHVLRPLHVARELLQGGGRRGGEHDLGARDDVLVLHLPDRRVGERRLHLRGLQALHTVRRLWDRPVLHPRGYHRRGHGDCSPGARAREGRHGGAGPPDDAAAARAAQPHALPSSCSCSCTSSCIAGASRARGGCRGRGQLLRGLAGGGPRRLRRAVLRAPPRAPAFSLGGRAAQISDGVLLCCNLGVLEGGSFHPFLDPLRPEAPSASGQLRWTHPFWSSAQHSAKRRKRG